jgi:hypothetical protein
MSRAALKSAESKWAIDLSVQDVMSSGSPARRKVEAVYGATLWPMVSGHYVASCAADARGA